MDFRVQSPVLEMDMYDKPLRLIDVKGDCNCLFQSLAYYVAGSENDYRLLRESVILFLIWFEKFCWKFQKLTDN